MSRRSGKNTRWTESVQSVGMELSKLLQMGADAMQVAHNHKEISLLLPSTSHHKILFLSDDCGKRSNV